MDIVFIGETLNIILEMEVFCLQDWTEGVLRRCIQNESWLMKSTKKMLRGNSISELSVV